MGKTSAHILATLLRHVKTIPSVDAVGVLRYRALLEKGALAFRPDPAIRIQPLRIHGIEARWIYPGTEDTPRVMMYIHGGGFIAGSMTSHGDLASRIALACDAGVLIFNYRLAPEYPFPAGLTDVMTVYDWITDRFGPERPVCLAGDSAGGNLALSLASTLLKSRKRLPACTVLMSPWLDLACRSASHELNKNLDPMLGPDILKKTAALYTDQPLSNPLVSPLHNDFTGITPILIQAGTCEVLLDDAGALARKLEEAGAIVELDVWEDMFHVWQYFARYLSEGREAIQRIGSFVRRHA